MMMTSRRKREILNNEDRLSSLPDALLTHILSLLSTEQSFCTSVLSTRWKHLFASVPALSFGLTNCPINESFVNFVNNVLRVHNVLCIKSFRLSFLSHFLDPDVYSWICAAVSRNPKMIDLNARLIQPSSSPACRFLQLPLGLFTCHMLVHLSLAGPFVFGVIETVRLPSLKTLIMSGCIVSNGDSASRLFSSCPVLEDLAFCSCDTPGVEVISISAPSLKSLTIESHDSKCGWELNAPNLEFIRCYGYTAKCSSVTILKSLHKADILLVKYDPEEKDVIWELVNKFDEVRHLFLSHLSMKSLARDPFSLPMLNKLATLKLRVSSYEGWYIFRTLLKRSPNLECLDMVEGGFSDVDGIFPEINVLLPERVPVCFSRSLKEVTIQLTEQDEVEDEWLRYLLKNAKVLEKLRLFVIPPRKENRWQYPEREASIRNKLLAFPRVSNTLKLIIYVGEYNVKGCLRNELIFGG